MAAPPSRSEGDTAGAHSEHGAHQFPPVKIPPAAVASLAAVLALVVLAPGRSNLLWSVNGMHGAGLLAVAALALGAAVLGFWGAGASLPASAAALLGALVLAGPLRESGHLLGDTYVRQRALTLAAEGGAVANFAEFGRLMHAQPLDNLLSVWGPAMLARAGVSVSLTLGVAGAALALLWWWAASRIARTLAPEGAPAAFAAALSIGGALEVFAGYAESGSVTLVFGALWWLAMLRPIGRPRHAVFAVLAWLAFACSHRLALVALVPQFARALMIRLDGDDDRSRRWLALGTLGAAILTAVAGSATTEAVLAQDFRELLVTAGRFTPATDLLNLLLVVAPLALLAPAIAGVARLREVARSPLGALHAAAFVPMAPLLISFPMAAHGLGAHRDWDLALVPGLLATTFAGAALARLEAARLRGALAMLLPALLLLAGAWLAPNASGGATLERAVTLVHGARGVTGEARAHALVYLGYRASDAGDDAASARWFDEAFGAMANPRTALLAAESWLRAGDPGAAGQSIGRARALGRLPADLEKVARSLEQALPIEAGSMGSSPGSHP